MGLLVVDHESLTSWRWERWPDGWFAKIWNRISKTHLFNWSRGLWSRRPVGIYHKAPISPFLPKDPTFLSAANHFTITSHFTIISHFAITSHFSLYTFIWFEELGITHFATEKLHILIYPPSLASEKDKNKWKLFKCLPFLTWPRNGARSSTSSPSWPLTEKRRFVCLFFNFLFDEHLVRIPSSLSGEASRPSRFPSELPSWRKYMVCLTKEMYFSTS